MVVQTNLNETTLRQDIYRTFYDHIGSNMPGTVNLRAAYESKKPSFPQVVLNPSKISTGVPSWGGGTARKKEKDCEAMIELYAKNPADIDTMADDIDGIFDDTFQGMHRMIVNDGDSDTLIDNQQKIHYKPIIVSFRRVGK